MNANERSNDIEEKEKRKNWINFRIRKAASLSRERKRRWYAFEWFRIRNVCQSTLLRIVSLWYFYWNTWLTGSFTLISEKSFVWTQPKIIYKHNRQKRRINWGTLSLTVNEMLVYHIWTLIKLSVKLIVWSENNLPVISLQAFPSRVQWIFRYYKNST